MNAKKKGILLIVVSALFFALTSASVKLAVHVPTVQKIFVRNLISVFIAAFILYKHKNSFKGNNYPLLFFRSITGLIGLVTYFYSIKYLPLGDAVSLNKLSPFFTMVLAAIFLKERLRAFQIPAICLAIVGAALISKPQFDYSFLPAAIGILGAFFAAASYTSVRELRKTDAPETIVFYFSLLSTLATLPFYNQFVWPSPKEGLALLGVGVFAIIAQFAMTYAYRYALASELSIYDYSQIVFSMLISLILGQALPDKVSLIGAGLVLVGGFLNYSVTKRKRTT